MTTKFKEKDLEYGKFGLHLKNKYSSLFLEKNNSTKLEIKMNSICLVDDILWEIVLALKILSGFGKRQVNPNVEKKYSTDGACLLR